MEMAPLKANTDVNNINGSLESDGKTFRPVSDYKNYESKEVVKEVVISYHNMMLI